MPNLLERDVQQWLSFILRGRREQVITDVGRLDIIVPGDGVEYVIEVKKATNFLSAIGQVLGYACTLENDKKNVERVRIIALFSWQNLKQERIQHCRDICKKNNIHCWLLDENFLRFIYDLERSQVDTGNDIRPSLHFLEQFRHHRSKNDRRMEFHKNVMEGITKKDEDEDEFVDESL
jgi:hypothetical protein